MGRYRTNGRFAGHVAALFVITARIDYACQCAEPTAPPCEAAWISAAVFVGAVNRVGLSETAVGWYSVKVQFTVDEPLLGINGRAQDLMIRTGWGGGDCGYHFEVGHNYIVYAHKLEDGSLATGICSRTRPMGEASDDLAYFHALDKACPKPRCWE